MVPASNLRCMVERKDGSIISIGGKNHNVNVKCKCLLAVGNWMVFLLSDANNQEGKGITKMT